MLIRLEFAIRLADASLSDDEKSVQGSRAANTMRGYGTPPSGRQSRNSAEDDRQREHRQQGPENRPQHADDGLFVPDGDVAPRPVRNSSR